MSVLKNVVFCVFCLFVSEFVFVFEFEFEFEFVTICLL